MPIQRDVLLFFYRRHPRNRPGAIRFDLRALAFFGTVLALIGLAGWLYLHQASEVAGYAHEIRELERQKERLHRELVALRAEVAVAGSLQRVQEAGVALGYVLPEATDRSRRLRLEYTAPTPSAPSATVPTPTDATLAQTGGQDSRPPGLIQRLREQFQAWLQAPPD